jgi:3',5'-cyclic AMP phosphodiesterase CpdA
VAEQITLLHVSDTQFGQHHIFGQHGLTTADTAVDTLTSRLLDDLGRVADSDGLRPDLLVVTGDLAERAMPAEFWWAITQCRFEPGELDPYVPSIRRVPADEPI